MSIRWCQILSDEKLIKLEPVVSFELNFEKHLLKLVKENLPVDICQVVRLVSLLQSWLYWLSKTHMNNVPVCSILLMIGSVPHKLAKWLAELLQPVLNIQNTLLRISLHLLTDYKIVLLNLMKIYCILFILAMYLLVFHLRKQ